MNALTLHPLDVWTVRDGRPFDVGGVVHARALWPPSPWTVLGVVRTALCEVSGVSAVRYGHLGTGDVDVSRAVELLGPPDGAPTFQLGPALLSHDTDVLWPVPQDVVTFTDEDDEGNVHLARLRLLRRSHLRKRNYGSSRADRELTLLPPHPPNGFRHPDKSPTLQSFDAAQLRAWLAGGSLPSVAKKDHRLPLETEPRIGIEMDDASNTVVEGRFYVRHAHALRSGWSLLVPVPHPGGDGVRWAGLEGQHVRLGADGHLASLTWQSSRTLWPEVSADVKRSGAGALLFLAPVHPDDFKELNINGTQVAVEAIAGGRPIALGGWQLRHDGARQVGPRRMRRYYPAGTVAYVRSGADLSALHSTSISCDPEEKAASFGFCLVGARPKKEE